MTFGFFDSGLGGLLMMQSCIEHQPYHNYIYVGDTLHLPYGPKGAQEIFDFMEPHLLWLFQEKKCDYVCVACNTASVKAVPQFIEKYPEYAEKFIDIITPTQQFLKAQKSALVLATQGTTSSQRYALGEYIKNVPMSGLVALIEDSHDEEALIMVQDALAYFPHEKTIILGCTHYLYLKEKLEKLYPNKKFVAQDRFIKEKIHSVAHSDISAISSAPSREFYVTKNHEEYSLKYQQIFKPI